MTEWVCAHPYLQQIASADLLAWAAGSGCLIIYMVMDGPGIACPWNSSPGRATVSPGFICGFFPVRRKAFHSIYCRQKDRESAVLAWVPNGFHCKLKKKKTKNNALTSEFLMLPTSSLHTGAMVETRVMVNAFLGNTRSPSLFCT